MRRIDKGAPPQCLAALRREARRLERDSGQPPNGDDWDPGACAQPTREALRRDQHGLCGYCMRAIQPHGHRDHPASGNGGMRIEHLVPRDEATGDPRRMYDWDNLLGVCGGRSGAPGGDLHDHCDRTRGSAPMTLDPTRTPNIAARFSYSRASPPGEVDDDDSLWVIAPDFAADVEVLNLNNPALRRHRREAERVIARQIEKYARRGRPIEPFLRRLVATATSPADDGTLPEFAPVVQRYCERKLRARG